MTKRWRKVQMGSAASCAMQASRETRSAEEIIFRTSEIAGGRDPAGASSTIKPHRGLATLLAAGQRISRLTAKTHSFTFQIIRDPPTCSFFVQASNTSERRLW